MSRGFSLRRVLFTAALVASFLALCSCRTIREVEIRYDTVVQTDTTEVVVHDTTKVVEVRVDSVDRLVEKTVYVDTNGVVHEKEVEKLTHYIYLQDEQYKVMASYYKKKASELEKKLEEKAKVEYIDKPLTWWQKTQIYGFWTLMAVVGIYTFIRTRKSLFSFLKSIYT